MGGRGEGGGEFECNGTSPCNSMWADCRIPREAFSCTFSPGSVFILFFPVSSVVLSSSRHLFKPSSLCGSSENCSALHVVSSAIFFSSLDTAEYSNFCTDSL